jgi:D-alanyl-D-alanine carboxypeptidase
VRLPSERLFVAVLSNNGASRPATVAHRLAALAIGRPFQDPPVVVVPTPTLDGYAGVYTMADDQRIIVSTANGQLILEQHGEATVLSPSSPNEFFEPGGVRRVTFQPDAATGAIGIRVWGWGEPVNGTRVRAE